MNKSPASDLAQPAQAHALPLNLTPRPGQRPIEIKAWIDLNVAGGPTSRMAARAYAQALYRSKSRDDTDEWYRSLTDFQQDVLRAAAVQKNADPKVRAERKAKRDADPVYQQALTWKRENYAAKIKEEQGRPVNTYRKGAALTPKERNEAARKRIRDQLSAGQNPFPVRKYDARSEYEITYETEARHIARFFVCETLLREGSISPSSPRVISMMADIATATSAEAEQLIVGAVETLRTAKAVRKRGDAIHLNKEISDSLTAIRLRQRSQDDK